METTNRFPAFLAYFLLIFGCLYVFIFERRDKFAVYHAKQSLLIVLTALAAPLVWAVVAWLLSWLPFGFLLGVALFSLVVATYIFLGVIWLLGMLYVSQTQAKPLPLIGGWAKWIPIR
ncbi:MAG: hypothetical protein L6R45_27865 [Anaerolineae bacterium]|nr:hypothetical protein [Anaerolineae bacterium]